MKKSGSKTIFFTILLVAFILIIGLYMAKNGNSTNSPSATSDSKTKDVQASILTIDDIFTGNIIYMVKSSDGSEIYKVARDGKANVIYTDKGEDLKIKNAVSVTAGGKVLALFAAQNQEFGGSLYLIDTDFAGKKTLISDQFASTQSPVISPNAKKIAYTIFSNVEADYGFSLYAMNEDGSNKQKISSDPMGIKILCWNPNSDKIAYLKGDSSKDSKIYIGDLAGSENNLISFKEKVYSLNWSNQIMTFSKGSSGEDDINKAEIFTMDEFGKNMKRITTDDKHNEFSFLSPDAKGIVYLEVSYNKSVDLNKSGDIILTNTVDSITKKLGEANYIIGWIGK